MSHLRAGWVATPCPGTGAYHFVDEKQSYPFAAVWCGLVEKCTLGERGTVDCLGWYHTVACPPLLA